MIDVEEKARIFANELDHISDKRVKEFTKLCIMSAPDYFFTDCPASSSGKYHAIDELSWDGTVIHTKRVFIVGYTLSRGMGIEDKRDLILSSCLIHDLLKQGINKSGHTQKNHPKLAADLVNNVQKDTLLLTDEEFKVIYNCVALHYGPWTVKEFNKPLVNYSMEELCVYLSDYVASKKFIEVKYKGNCYE